MTGAPMPPGADAVVMVEDSELLDGEKVRLGVAVAAGTSVRAAGDDVRRGDVVFRAGTVVTPAVARRARQHQRPVGARLSAGPCRRDVDR